jgi:DmsE family decaheme c-type cytochrome
MSLTQNKSKLLKLLMIVLFAGGLVWMTPETFLRTKVTGSAQGQGKKSGSQAPAKAKHGPEEYSGSESCRDCHSEKFESLAKTPHARILTMVDKYNQQQGCETCHGPGKAHVEGGGDATKIVRFKEEPAREISQTCLECHNSSQEHNNFLRGEHGRNDVACIDCHSLHSADLSKPKMLAKSEPQLCITCHSEMKVDFTRPFRHRVMEGAIKCSDCHNPHGGFDQKQLRASNGTDIACLKCHLDKQGPFVFEHAPLKVEGCTICHIPHGANNPKMLRRDRVFQLCIECHSNVGTVGGPNTPSFHNLNSARYQNCTTCHVKIHGSNTQRFFFR